MMKTINEVAERYFDTLNPLAERISTDILNIKKINQDLWHNLSVDEQNQIINDNLVYPEAILKYNINSDPCQQNINISLKANVTGAKYVVDENTGVSWRDEHSAPFSWKTPSQIDLTIFTSSNGDNVITNGGFNITNISNNTQAYVANELQSEKNFQLKLDNDSLTIGNSNKNDLKTLNLSPESANVVLVGTCSKLSGFCSKLKFMPSKSYSYEVQTVLTNSSNTNDSGFLDKIKASAVLKLQNTLKFVGNKSSDKKSSAVNNDTQNLVQFKSPASIVKMSKPSPKISKPKSPPPPPPVLNLPLKTETVNLNNLISVKTINEENCFDDDSEEKLLLGNKSLNVSDCDKNEFESLQMNVKHELSEDFNSLNTECTPLSGPNIDIIPKSGFDFLDNW